MQEQASASASAISDDQETVGPTPVTKLEMAGINASDIKKLQEAGLHTIEAVAYSRKKVLADIKGFSDAKADKLLVNFFSKFFCFLFS